MLNKIDLPKHLEVQRQELYKKKAEEAQQKLNLFLKENELSIQPVLQTTISGIYASFVVVPNSFLKKDLESKSTDIKAL